MNYLRQQEDGKKYLEAATDAYKRIQACKLNIKKMFPNQEHLASNPRLNLETKNSLREFLLYDYRRLVKYRDLYAIVERSQDYLSVYDPKLLEALVEICNRAHLVSEGIIQGFQYGEISYTVAKSLCADMLSIGVRIEEADQAIAIVADGRIKQVEELRNSDSNVFSLISEITGGCHSPKKMLPVVKGEKAKPDCEKLQYQVDNFLGLPYVTHKDMMDVQSLIAKCEGCPIRDLHTLENILEAYKWTMNLEKVFNLSSKCYDLLTLVNHLVPELINLGKTPEELLLHEDLIRQGCNIKSSMLPFSRAVIEAKVLYWEKEFAETTKTLPISLELLQKLRERYPKNASVRDHSQLPPLILVIKETLKFRAAVAEFRNSKLVKAKSYRDPDAQALKELDDKVAEMREEIKAKSKYVDNTALLADMDFIEDLKKLVRFVSSSVEKEKIDIQKLNELKELASRPLIEKELKGSPLLIKFNSLVKSYTADHKLLLTFANKACDTVVLKIPDLYDPKFVEHVRSLIPLQDLRHKIASLEKIFFFGNELFPIKDFITKFLRAEESLTLFQAIHPLQILYQASSEKLASVRKDFESMKQDLRIKVFSDKFEETARYELGLKILEVLSKLNPRPEVLQRLNNYAANLEKMDKTVMSKLKQARSESSQLKDKIEDFFKGPNQSYDRMSQLYSEAQNSHFCPLPQLRLIEHHFQDAHFILSRYDRLQSLVSDSENPRQLPFKELHSLWTSYKQLKCSMDHVEDHLKILLEKCKAIRIGIICHKKDSEFKRRYPLKRILQDYKETNIRIEEVEPLFAVYEQDHPEVFLEKSPNLRKKGKVKHSSASKKEGERLAKGIMMVERLIEQERTQGGQIEVNERQPEGSKKFTLKKEEKVNEFPEYKRSLFRTIKEKLTDCTWVQSKVEAVKLAGELERYLEEGFSKKEAAYKIHLETYLKFLEKFSQKGPLCQLIIFKNPSLELLDGMVSDASGDWQAINNPLEARLYLQAHQDSLWQDVKYEDPEEYLKKRDPEALDDITQEGSESEPEMEESPQPVSRRIKINTVIAEEHYDMPQMDEEVLESENILNEDTPKTQKSRKAKNSKKSKKMLLSKKIVQTFSEVEEKMAGSKEGRSGVIQKKLRSQQRSTATLLRTLSPKYTRSPREKMPNRRNY